MNLTDGQSVGLVLLAAAVSLIYLYWLAPLIPAVRDCRRLNREWNALQARVDAARADFDDVRATERETLIERIARDEMAPFFTAWDERVAK